MCSADSHQQSVTCIRHLPVGMAPWRLAACSLAQQTQHAMIPRELVANTHGALA